LKRFILRYKKLHIWLAADAALLAFYYAGENSRPLMNFVSARITQPFKTGSGVAAVGLSVFRGGR
jgi:hypothetical protein